MIPMDVTTVPLTAVRPSQCYLNAEKVAAVAERVDGEVFDPGPLPVYNFDGEHYLTDGHTRAFVAHLTGRERLGVTYDVNLAADASLPVYRECIEWCNRDGIETITDLAGRVVGPETYQAEWIEPCQAIAARIEAE
ncbi:ParB-like nuclease domain-containing protein [Halorhabdus sp. BNX81]|nr:ParB-like nuclease domain-containing protein [Halorhabdus sp. BNX81]